LEKAAKTASTEIQRREIENCLLLAAANMGDTELVNSMTSNSKSIFVDILSIETRMRNFGHDTEKFVEHSLKMVDGNDSDPYRMSLLYTRLICSASVGTGV
jgi:hypothetical protein